MMTSDSTPAPADRDWFYWREALPGLWLIAEPSHVYTWLIIGSDRACLFDTGTGFSRIRPVVEQITSLPVVVVNSHYHFDHVGGNHEFDRVAIHSAGRDLVNNPNRPDVVSLYLEFVRARDRQVESFRAEDAELFGLLTVETDPRALPGRILAAEMNGKVMPEVDVLAEGDTIDLGDRVLSVIHTPGHSPDGISLLDERRGWLMSGDAFNLGQVYCHFHDSSLEQLSTSAEKLADLSSELSVITAHHYPRIIAEPNLLAEYRGALGRVGDLPQQPSVDVLGQPCRLVTSDHFSVTLPDPDHPAMVG
jgi:glyoxylase-like metal-dependent hydrolase (beta-lactamase superfamily II)